MALQAMLWAAVIAANSPVPVEVWTEAAHHAEPASASAFSVYVKSLLALIATGLLFMAPVEAEVPAGSLAAPVCPPQAIAAGFTHPIFWQTFGNLNAIDLTNSKVAGF